MRCGLVPFRYMDLVQLFEAKQLIPQYIKLIKLNSLKIEICMKIIKK